jgi:hypothetical protein
MNKEEKIEHLNSKWNELKDFESTLTNSNLVEFNKLKNEISDLLDDNERLRFNQIEFYFERQEISIFDIDDLPF